MAEFIAAEIGKEVSITSCDICTTDENVNWFCSDCEEVLCDRCKLSHSNGRKTKNDKVVPLSQRHLVKRTLPRIPSALVCKKHDAKTCEFYCEKCRKPICLECLSAKHKKHEWKTLNDIRKEIKVDLDRGLNVLRDRLKAYHSVSSSDTKHHEKFSKQVVDMKKKIDQRSEHLIQEVKAIQAKRILEITNIEQEEKKRFAASSESINYSITGIQTLINNVLTDMHSDDIIILSRLALDLYEKVRHCSEITPSSSDIPRFTYDRFQGSKLEKMFGVIHSKGNKCEQITQGNIFKEHAVVDMNVNKAVRIICPIDHKSAWIAFYGTTCLTKFRDGKTIDYTKNIEGNIMDAAMNVTEDILVTSWPSSKIWILTTSTPKLISVFADVSPLMTQGLDISKEHQVYVCLKSCDRDVDSGAKIAVFSMAGTKLRIIHHDIQGRQLFNWPHSVACLPNGDLAVVDRYSAAKRVVVIVNNGNIKYWIDEAPENKPFDPARLACDKSGGIYVTERSLVGLYMIDDGKMNNILSKVHGIRSPVGIAVDVAGRIWVGCEEGKIHIIG